MAKRTVTTAVSPPRGFQLVVEFVERQLGRCAFELGRPERRIDGLDPGPVDRDREPLRDEPAIHAPQVAVQRALQPRQPAVLDPIALHPADATAGCTGASASAAGDECRRRSGDDLVHVERDGLLETGVPPRRDLDSSRLTEARSGKAHAESAERLPGFKSRRSAEPQALLEFRLGHADTVVRTLISGRASALPGDRDRDLACIACSELSTSSASAVEMLEVAGLADGPDEIGRNQQAVLAVSWAVNFSLLSR